MCEPLWPVRCRGVHESPHVCSHATVSSPAPAICALPRRPCSDVEPYRPRTVRVTHARGGGCGGTDGGDQCGDPVVSVLYMRGCACACECGVLCVSIHDDESAHSVRVRSVCSVSWCAGAATMQGARRVGRRGAAACLSVGLGLALLSPSSSLVLPTLSSLRLPSAAQGQVCARTAGVLGVGGALVSGAQVAQAGGGGSQGPTGRGGDGRGWFGGGGGGGEGVGGGGEGMYVVSDAKGKSGGAGKKVKMVVEQESKVRFPVRLLLDEKDTSGLALVSAGVRKGRPWRRFWARETEYALGLYVDEGQAQMALRAAIKAGAAQNAKHKQSALVSEAVASPATSKAVRIIMTKEMDAFDFVRAINDKIEEPLARRSFVDLAWLELWRNWMAGQGGYKQKLARGVEVRLVWQAQTADEPGRFTTQFRRRDRILSEKTLDNAVLGQAVFDAFVSKSVAVAPAATDEFIDAFANKMKKKPATPAATPAPAA